MLDLSESILNASSDNKCIILVLLDFSNAFPSINHETLIEILNSIGLDKISIKWFKSFLERWHQSVKWNDESSEYKPINVGVFQGEGCSQLLFSLFINNISKCIRNCNLRQFADDTAISIECNINNDSLVDSIWSINDDLQRIHEFCGLYQLTINPSKSKAIILSTKYNLNKIKYSDLPPITINNEFIAFADNVKYLGYQFDRAFLPRTHINAISKRFYTTMSQLHPLKHKLSD